MTLTCQLWCVTRLESSLLPLGILDLYSNGEHFWGRSCSNILTVENETTGRTRRWSVGQLWFRAYATWISVQTNANNTSGSYQSRSTSFIPDFHRYGSKIDVPSGENGRNMSHTWPIPDTHFLNKSFRLSTMMIFSKLLKLASMTHHKNTLFSIHIMVLFNYIEESVVPVKI